MKQLRSIGDSFAPMAWSLGRSSSMGDAVKSPGMAWTKMDTEAALEDDKAWAETVGRNV